MDKFVELIKTVYEKVKDGPFAENYIFDEVALIMAGQLPVIGNDEKDSNEYLQNKIRPAIEQFNKVKKPDGGVFDLYFDLIG